MKIYKIAQDSNAENEYYKVEGKNLLNDLKKTIPNIVGGNFIVLREAFYSGTPSSSKWYESEYNVQNRYSPMAKLVAQLTGAKGPLNLHEIHVWASVNSQGEYQFTGKVMEINHDPEAHRRLEQKRNEKLQNNPDSSADTSIFIKKYLMDRLTLGTFGGEEREGVSLDFARNPTEAAQRIKKIIWDSGDSNSEEYVDPPEFSNPVGVDDREFARVRR